MPRGRLESVLANVDGGTYFLDPLRGWAPTRPDPVPEYMVAAAVAKHGWTAVEPFFPLTVDSPAQLERYEAALRRHAFAPSPRDASNQCLVLRPSVQRAVTWRIIAELMLRHHTLCRLRLYETHPCDGGYDCLSLYADTHPDEMGQHLHSFGEYGKEQPGLHLTQLGWPDGNDYVHAYLTAPNPADVINAIEKALGLPSRFPQQKVATWVRWCSYSSPALFERFRTAQHGGLPTAAGGTFRSSQEGRRNGSAELSMDRRYPRRHPSFCPRAELSRWTRLCSAAGRLRHGGVSSGNANDLGDGAHPWRRPCHVETG